MPAKRAAAVAAGAAQAVDPSDPEARRAVLKATGGVLAACDFVGSEKSLQFSTGVLARGGKVVVTGLLGGNFSIAAAMIAIKAMTIEGTLTGTLAEARELIDLARTGNLAAIPTHERPLNQAQAALDDLRAGRVVGRTVLSVMMTVRMIMLSGYSLLAAAHEVGQADLPLAPEPLCAQGSRALRRKPRLCRD